MNTLENINIPCSCAHVLYHPRHQNALLTQLKNSPGRQILQHLLGQDAQVVASLNEAFQDDVGERNVQRNVLNIVVDSLEALFHHFNGHDAALFERLQQFPHRVFHAFVERFESHDDDLGGEEI